MWGPFYCVDCEEMRANPEREVQGKERKSVCKDAIYKQINKEYVEDLSEENTWIKEAKYEQIQYFLLKIIFFSP